MPFQPNQFVSPEVTALGSFLGLHKFRVPDNQRDFSWADEQLNKFWKDLEQTANRNYSSGALTDSPEPHFLGAIVLEHVGWGEERPLIDGQQRLVTSTVLYSVLYEFASHVTDQSKRENMQGEILQRIAVMAGGDRSPRIVLGEAHQFYDGYVVQRLSHSAREQYFDGLPVQAKGRVVQRLRKCENFFYDKISEALMSGGDKVARLRSFLATLGELFIIVPMSVPSARVAYRIFETLNERGMELSQADLIKNEILRMADRQASKITTLNNWRETRERLDDVDQAMTSYIRYQYISKHEAVRANELFDKIQSHLISHSALDYSNELKQEAAVYQDIIDASSVWGADTAALLNEIKTLDIGHAYPLLLSGALRFSNDLNSFSRLVRATRDFCFRFLTIGRRRPGELEERIGAAARNCRSQTKDLDEIITLLREDAPDEQFRLDFAKASPGTTKIQFYILRAIESYLAAGQGIQVLDHSPSQHIEHIMPKRLGDSHWQHIDVDKHQVYLDNLGNLLVLERSINVYIANKGFDEKNSNAAQKDYRHSALKLPGQVSRFLKNGLWTEQSIQERQAALAEIAVDVWPLR